MSSIAAVYKNREATASKATVVSDDHGIDVNGADRLCYCR